MFQHKPSTFARPLSSLSLAAALAALPALAGCDENKKLSEQGAADEVAQLAPVVKEDVEQIRKGLPEGAKKLAALDADTLSAPAALQKAVAGARASVPDLAIAKSTFFSYVDATGTVVRSEGDPDLLAGKSVVKALPGLQKALDPASGNVEVFGEMPEMRGVKTGPDLAWAVGHPIKDDKGAVKGMFLTGWSFRAFAYHLELTAKRHVADAAQKAGKKLNPIVYVFAVKGKTAYGAPLTPDVNAQAIEGLNVVEKTAGGPFHTSLEITGRVFGAAAQRTPELGDDAAVAVLLSEI
ncbi:MAG: hypothetical protein U0359_29200 [Byssovorax sp.]